MNKKGGRKGLVSYFTVLLQSQYLVQKVQKSGYFPAECNLSPCQPENTSKQSFRVKFVTISDSAILVARNDWLNAFLNN